MATQISTVKKRIDALLKFDPHDLDFGDVENGESIYHDDIEQMHRDLMTFARNLRDGESKFVAAKHREQILHSFGQLVDQYDGDTEKALAVFQQVVDSSKANKAYDSHSETDAQHDDESSDDLDGLE